MIIRTEKQIEDLVTRQLLEIKGMIYRVVEVCESEKAVRLESPFRDRRMWSYDELLTYTTKIVF